jgi:DNA-binding response OmpR family regulator
MRVHADAASIGDGVSSKRPLLLIVDDDRRTALLLGRLLREDGYDTEVEPDGTAALARLAHEPIPDALITDYHVPGANGLAISRQARACRAGIPVFVVTGDPHTAERSGIALESGIEVIAKPVDYASLVVRLRVAVPVFA